MKKVLPLMVMAVAASLFTSCKKDYTCTCTMTNTIMGSTTTNSQAYPIKDASKGDAKKACDDMTTAFTLGTTTASCKL